MRHPMPRKGKNKSGNIFDKNNFCCSKMDRIHEDDYQRKLFSAAQNYMGQKHKKDLLENIRRFNWKVQTGQ